MSFSHLVLVRFNSLDRSVVVSTGTTVLEAVLRVGITLNSSCNGQQECHECQVQVLSGQVSAVTPVEAKLFNSEQLAQGYRLACFARIQSPIKVNFIPESQFIVNGQAGK